MFIEMKAIPFHASVRIKLGAGSTVEDKDKNIIGINVNAKTIKNKVSAPFRKCEFRIIFGVGIKEHEELFDFLRPLGETEVIVGGKQYEVSVSGTSGHKNLLIKDDKGSVLHDKSFYKARFNEILDDPTYKPYLDALIEKHMTRKLTSMDDIDIDDESLVEVEALANELLPDGMSPEDA